MLISLTIRFNSTCPEASWSAKSVVAIPVPSFLMRAEPRLLERLNVVGVTLNYTAADVSGHRPDPHVSWNVPGYVTSWTRLPRGRTAPCCGIYYIVMRPIPAPAFSLRRNNTFAMPHPAEPPRPHDCSAPRRPAHRRCRQCSLIH